MIGVGCRVELLLQCKIFYFPAGDEVSSAVPCAPLTFPKPAMPPRSLLLHIDSISVLRLPSFYPASLSLLVPDSGRARAHVSDMSYAPLNDGSEAMLTREEQASIHHEPRLSKPSRARRSRSCRQIWLCVPSNADKTRPPIYAQAEAVDDMEGALHYQNVAAPTGPSQRAKSSTYPTNSMYARAQETMLKMREMAKDGMAKAAKTAKQGMASLERSINAPPAWSAAGVSSRPAGQRTAVGVNPPGFNGDSTVNGALDNDVAISERLQGAEAAAEMLFEMRAANDGNPTPEEAEMLSELRAVCEQHLNVLARSVERGAGLIGESLLMKCIEVAESLVSAIGDGEKPGDDASSGGAGGYSAPGSGAGDAARGDETAVVDLLGGLDVSASDAPSPAAGSGEDGRPATAAEEEAMIAAAIAASLAEGGDEQKRPPTTQQQAPQPPTGNLIDI